MRHIVQRCPEGRWELARAYPGHDLAREVVGYSGYVEASGPPFRNREVATAIVPVIVNLGADFHVALGQSDTGARYGSFVAGLYDGYADVAATGRSRCMQIDFTPPGAYRFFGLPMRELAGRVIRLGDIIGRRADLLTEQLRKVSGWGARFGLLDSFVRTRFDARPATSAEVLWVWRTLLSSGGAASVGALAADVGWSRKHLAARFAIEIGETPKTAARILRFMRVRREIARAHGTPCWAGLAADCGFADQAHLIREFRSMAGVTPARYAFSLVGHDGLPPAEAR